MIEYTNNNNDINESMLQGFFVGWLNTPSPTTHMEILKNSYCAWMAIDTSANRIIGFINAISDGVLSAYIPLLEVLPEYQSNGVGAQLVTRMLDSLNHLYMVDLLCDEPLQGYYAKHGMRPASGVMVRNYNNLKED